MEKYTLALYSPINSTKKQYQLVKLSNGILTLLISDPSEKTASCSLTVAAGSFNDPDNLPGLAHLCEHMILAGGSKKHPEVTAFRDKLTKNNGQRNAYTTGQETSFYFYMPNSQMLKQQNDYTEKPPFENLLNIFGSCFEEPLFKSNELSNEIIAIDNEHAGNKANQRKLLYHASRLLSNNNHPFSRFSTGNLNSLKTIVSAEKIHLISELKDYIDQKFYGNNITLCLKSSDSLNVLLRQASNAFSNIKAFPVQKSSLLNKFKFSGNSEKKGSKTPLVSRKISLTNFSVFEESWKTISNVKLFSSSNENIIFLKGKASSNVLRIIMPVFYQDFKTQFSKKQVHMFYSYWIDIFGEESQGSFDNYLKFNGYAKSSLAYTTEYAINNDGLVLELRLTNKGWKNLKSILNTFQNRFIPNLLCNDNIEALAKLFSEQNTVDILKFLYQDVSQNPIQECSNFSSQVLTRSFSNFIDHEYLLKGIPFLFYSGESYCESDSGKKHWLEVAKKWQVFLTAIINKNEIKFIVSGDPKTLNTTGVFAVNLELESNYTTDSHFGFNYIKSHINLEKEIFDSFNFLLAPPNIYIPEIARGSNKLLFSFLKSLKKTTSNESPTSLVLNNSIYHTNIILASENEKHQLWTKNESHNTIFKSKSFLSISLINDFIEPSPLNTMFLELLTEIIGIEMSRILYPATKVGYSVSVSPSPRGDVSLKIAIDGFADGLIDILDSITSFIKNLSLQEVNKSVLKQSRINVRNKFESASTENGFKLSLIGLYIVLDQCVWNLEDRFVSLEDNVDVESFSQFVSDFISNLKVLIVHHGDINSKDSMLINQHLSTNITNHFKSGVPKTKFKKNHIAQTFVLPYGSDIIVKNKPPEDDPNSSISYFLQIGKFGTIEKDPLGFTQQELYSLTKLTEFLFELHLVPDLRIKRHLGYIVAGGTRALSTSFGIHISAMSSSTPTVMEKKINDYLFDLEKCLSKLGSEEFFKNNYIDEYLKVLKSTLELGQILEDTTLPSNILQSVPSNFLMRNDSILQSQYNFHKKLFDSIALERFNFYNLNYDDNVSIEFISSITLSKFMTFFNYYISIESSKRSKISIHIATDVSEKERQNSMIIMQLNTFLNMKGFKFDSDAIKLIVEKNNANTTGILKDLYLYFSNQGDSMKFILAGFKELFKSIASGLVQSSDLTPSLTKKFDSGFNVTEEDKTDIKSNGIHQEIVTNSNHFKENRSEVYTFI
ncbi:hypothetical protein QEN19_000114 [Hanseniaspora menglaensis]